MQGRLASVLPNVKSSDTRPQGMRRRCPARSMDEPAHLRVPGPKQTVQETGDHEKGQRYTVLHEDRREYLRLVQIAVVHGKRDSVAEDLTVPLRGGDDLLQRDRLDAPAAQLAKQPTNVLGLVAANTVVYTLRAVEHEYTYAPFTEGSQRKPNGGECRHASPEQSDSAVAAVAHAALLLRMAALPQSAYQRVAAGDLRRHRPCTL